MIHILLGFFLGILLISFGIPVLESLAGLVMAMIEAARGYFGIVVTKYNTEIQEIIRRDMIQHVIDYPCDIILIQEIMQPEESVTNTIGFCLPQEEEEELEFD